MRVCLVLMSGLGDVVHGLPLVNALKRADPATRITWVVQPMPAPILTPHPAVDEVVLFDAHEGVPALRRLRRQLGGRGAPRFDVALNLNTYFKAIWPTLFSRAPLRIGIDRRRTRDPVWLATNRTLPPGPVRHTQDIFLEFLAVLGIPAEPLEWRLAPTPTEAAEEQAFFEPLRQDGRPIASIVVASGNARKDWTPEGYAAVADALERDLGFRTMLVGGPAEREVALARAVAERARVQPVWALGDGVRRVLGLLHGSDLVIAPDTGPLHMARAMDVPVVGLFGHTNPWRVGPYRRFQDLWVDHYNEPGEPPDASKAEPKLGRMETITPAEVLARVERAIAKYRVAEGQRQAQPEAGARPPEVTGADRQVHAGEGQRHTDIPAEPPAAGRPQQRLQADAEVCLPLPANRGPRDATSHDQPPEVLR